MTLATTCRQCGREYELDPAAIRAGQWRLCPACRETAQEPPHQAESKGTAPDA
jgi:uncharacterized protein (DUF983 family)